MKNDEYHTVPKSNMKIVQTEEKSIAITHINSHDRSSSWLGTATSPDRSSSWLGTATTVMTAHRPGLVQLLRSNVSVKIVLWPKPPLLWKQKKLTSSFRHWNYMYSPCLI